MTGFENPDRHTRAEDKPSSMSHLVDFECDQSRRIFGSKSSNAHCNNEIDCSPDVYRSNLISGVRGQNMQDVTQELGALDQDLKLASGARLNSSQLADMNRELVKVELMLTQLELKMARSEINQYSPIDSNQGRRAPDSIPPSSDVGSTNQPRIPNNVGDGVGSTNQPRIPNNVGDGVGSTSQPGVPNNVGDGVAPSTNYLPPAQDVGWSAGRTWQVPPGYIFGVDIQGGNNEMKGVYAAPVDGWDSMVWRWKSANRPDSITAGSGPDGVASYKFTLNPGDKPDQGTLGGNPRSELFSVDQAEKTRQAEAPASSIVKDGDNVWLSFGTYIPSDFNQNQRWATLFQLKQQDTAKDPPGWATISVHGKYLDFNTPMAKSDSEAPDARVARIPIDEIAGKWAQFTIHEKASTGAGGLYEVYMNGKLLGSYNGPTVQSGIEYHVQYGYYRDGKTATSDTVYGTPIMEYRGENPGKIPNLIANHGTSNDTAA